MNLEILLVCDVGHQRTIDIFFAMLEVILVNLKGFEPIPRACLFGFVSSSSTTVSYQDLIGLIYKMDEVMIFGEVFRCWVL